MEMLFFPRVSVNNCVSGPKMMQCAAMGPPAHDFCPLRDPKVSRLLVRAAYVDRIRPRAPHEQGKLFCNELHAHYLCGGLDCFARVPRATPHCRHT